MPGYLFKNANLVLDGEPALQPSYNVLVKDDRITTVTRDPIAADGASVIDVAGRTLMPGLIDAHAHVTGLSLSPKNLAYPTAEIAVMGPSGAVNILYRRELQEAGERAEELRARRVAEYREKFSNPYVAAERGFVDAVIAPRVTRREVSRALRQLHGKRISTPSHKHGNLPL